MQSTRYGRVNVAEVCGTSDSQLSGAVTSRGARAVATQSLEWFDPTTKMGTEI